jgi:aminoglycoside 6-adenylyltransferase
MRKEILGKIVDWAKKEDEIKALILIGSLAGKGSIDELSDFDISVFTTNPEKYAKDDSWFHNFEKVWVCEPCELSRINKTYQTRLVIFKDGLQVDFALFDLDVLKDLTGRDELPVDYSLGYKVLLDKDGLTKNLKSPTFKCPAIPKPSQKEFELAIRIFFFEAFKQAKALVRNDLGHAKIRDWITKKYLLKMIEWNEKAKHGWDYNVGCAGKRMQSWVDKKTWIELHKTFAHFDAQDSWEALMATINIFSKIAKQTAKLFDYEYLEDVDQNITMFIKKLKKN